MKIKLGVVVILVLLRHSSAANILGVIATPLYSHQAAFWPLWEQLSLRGHNVTVITTHPMNNLKLVNLTEINIHGIYQYLNLNMFDFVDQPILKTLIDLPKIILNTSEYVFKNDKVNALINDRNTHFDVVMIEAFHTAPLAFATRFECPLIIITSLDGDAYAYNEIGNPSHLILHPDMNVPFYNDLSFSQRLASIGTNVFIEFVQKYLLLPDQQKLVYKYFGENYPLLRNIFKNYSAFFVNSNPFLHPIRPLLPNVIQIGGTTHVHIRGQLPESLQMVLDSAKNGVIYFSLGSNIKSQHLYEHVRQEILTAFEDLPYTVLWKFEDDNLPNIPDNVILSKWFPQKSILKHPNVKLFITQGGVHSLEEAILSHVPIIGIPIYGDQFANVGRAVSKGLGLSLNYKDIRKDSLQSAIFKVIQTPKYRNRVKEVASILQDQPETGLNKAIWWTEYVIRHKGAAHLQNPGINLPIYQYYYLDIMAFLLFCITTSVLSLVGVWKTIVMVYRVLKHRLKVKVM